MGDAMQNEVIMKNQENLDDLRNQYDQLRINNEENTILIKGYKDEVEAQVKENADKIDQMNVTIDTHYHELSDRTNDHVNQIQGLWDNNKSVEDGLKILKDSDEELRIKIAAIEKAKDELARELETSIDSTNNSLEAIQNHVHKVDELGIDTKDKVDNLEPVVKEHGLAIIRIEKELGAIPEQLDSVKNELQQGIDNQNEAISQLKDDHEKRITALEEKIKEILETLNQLNKDDIDELMKARKDLDEKLEELESRMQEAGDVTSNTLNIRILELKNDNEKALEELEKRMDANIKDLAGELEEELKTAKGNLETTQDMLLTTIDGVKSDNEKSLGELEVKLNDSLLELYNRDIHGMKEEAKRNESELENVSSLVQNVQINIGEVRTQAQEADTASKDQIRKLRTETEQDKKDLWKTIHEVYGALRGYTVVLSSSGSAAEQQMTCLGVYRMVGDFNKKPLYKQDEGENYLYYQNKTWLVGPKLNVSHAGAHSGDNSSCFNDYAWVKLDGGKSDGASSSDESSSSSDSESEDEEHRQKKLKSKTKRASMELFKQGWQYKSSLMGVELTGDGDDPVGWMGDDTTLKVEALRDIQMIGDVIENIKRSKQID